MHLETWENQLRSTRSHNKKSHRISVSWLNLLIDANTSMKVKNDEEYARGSDKDIQGEMILAD